MDDVRIGLLSEDPTPTINRIVAAISANKSQYTKIIRSLHQNIEGLTPEEQKRLLHQIRYIIGNNPYTMIRLGTDLIHDIGTSALQSTGEDSPPLIDFLVDRSENLPDKAAYKHLLRRCTSNPKVITEELDSYGTEKTPFISFPWSDIAGLNAYLTRIGVQGVVYDFCFRNLFELGLKVPAYYANAASRFDASIKPAAATIQRAGIEFVYNPDPIHVNNFFGAVSLDIHTDAARNTAIIKDTGEHIATCTCPVGLSINAICGAIGLKGCRGAGEARALLSVEPAGASPNHIITLKPAGDIGISMIPLEHKLAGRTVALISSDSFMGQLCQEKVDILISVRNTTSQTVDVFIFNPALKTPNYVVINRHLSEILSREEALAEIAIVYQRVKNLVFPHTSAMFTIFDNIVEDAWIAANARYTELKIIAEGGAEVLDYTPLYGLQTMTVNTLLHKEFIDTLASAQRSFLALADKMRKAESKHRQEHVLLDDIWSLLEEFMKTFSLEHAGIYAVLVISTMKSSAENFISDIEAQVPAEYKGILAKVKKLQARYPLSFGSYIDDNTADRIGKLNGSALKTIAGFRIPVRINVDSLPNTLPGKEYVQNLVWRQDSDSNHTIIPQVSMPLHERIRSDNARLDHAIYGYDVLISESSSDKNSDPSPPNSNSRKRKSRSSKPSKTRKVISGSAAGGAYAMPVYSETPVIDTLTSNIPFSRSQNADKLDQLLNRNAIDEVLWLLYDDAIGMQAEYAYFIQNYLYFLKRRPNVWPALFDPQNPSHFIKELLTNKQLKTLVSQVSRGISHISHLHKKSHPRNVTHKQSKTTHKQSKTTHRMRRRALKQSAEPINATNTRYDIQYPMLSLDSTPIA